MAKFGFLFRVKNFSRVMGLTRTLFGLPSRYNRLIVHISEKIALMDSYPNRSLKQEASFDIVFHPSFMLLG